MKPAQLTGMLVGVWLMVSPALLGYAGEPAADFHRVVGPLAASLSLIAVWDATRGLVRLLLLLGPALMIGALFIGHPAPAVANAFTGGGLLTATAPCGGISGPLGGGWRSLISPAPTGPRNVPQGPSL